MSGLTGEVRVLGVADALAALESLGPELQAQTYAAMQDAARPLAAAVAAALPAAPPVSGMARGRHPYTSASRRADARAGGSAPVADGSWPLVTVYAGDAAAVIADMAGRGSSGRGSGVYLIAALNARGGRASRYVWPAAQSVMPRVEAAVVKACIDAATAIGRQLAKPATGA